jgi:hypothetical protein
MSIAWKGSTSPRREIATAIFVHFLLSPAGQCAAQMPD